jgi:hypothetical protein
MVLQGNLPTPAEEIFLDQQQNLVNQKSDEADEKHADDNLGDLDQFRIIRHHSAEPSRNAAGQFRRYDGQPGRAQADPHAGASMSGSTVGTTTCERIQRLLAPCTRPTLRWIGSTRATPTSVDVNIGKKAPRKIKNANRASLKRK